MNRILLSYNKCYECGKCCFECEYLDHKEGCTNHQFRLNSRCASFPLLFGTPSTMGHNINQPSNNNSTQFLLEKLWFIYEYPECFLQQDEILFNHLRWILDDINNKNPINFFYISYEERSLSLEIYL